MLNFVLGMLLFSAFKMSGTIFDSLDFLGDAYDDMLFWDVFNDIDYFMYVVMYCMMFVMLLKCCKVWEVIWSLLVRSDATGSFKLEAKFIAVEKRLRDFEVKLLCGEYYVFECVGVVDVVLVMCLMIFDDIVCVEVSGKKCTFFGGSDERENVTSVRE